MTRVPSELRLPVHSTLLATLAFNLVFFVQELFLVLPKALTPGLQPTLYHNNHGWTGDHPLAALWQGTGAVAAIILALVMLTLARRRARGSATVRLLMVWVAFSGFFQALPQAVIGAFVPANDVGMAMDWFGLGQTAKYVVAMVAVAAMVWAGRVLARHFHGFLPGVRSGLAIFYVATLPALAAILLILPFRVPGEIVQVAIVPVIMNGAGAFFVQLGAIGRRSSQSAPPGFLKSDLWPLGWLLAVLAVFQILLRPGIPF